MKKAYYKVLYLLIEKPISNVIINIILVIIIQIISKRVILAEEYYHPFMGEKVIHANIFNKNVIYCDIPQLKFRHQFYELFDIRMRAHIKTLMNTSYNELNINNLDLNLIQAYDEITGKFYKIYRDNPNQQDMAKECIIYCKKIISNNMWNSKDNISNMNIVYLKLIPVLKIGQPIGEILFLNSLFVCLQTQDWHDIDRINNMFIGRLIYEENFYQITNPFFNNVVRVND